MPVSKKSTQKTSKMHAKNEKIQEHPETDALRNLFNVCTKFDPMHDLPELRSARNNFVHASGAILEEMKAYHTQIASIPLPSIIIYWAEEMSKNAVFGERCVEIMKELLEYGILPYSNEKNTILTLEDYQRWPHEHIIDFIRTLELWSFEKKEDYVRFYIDFTKWLSITTFGYISIAADSERQRVHNRKVPFELYLKILKELSLREQIIAKLLYLGFSKSLEEVLSINLDDLNECQIRFLGRVVIIPSHLRNDIENYIGTRTKGFVFANRSGDRIDTTVPYRALKTVVDRLKLDPSFTFKDFTRDI